MNYACALFLFILLVATLLPGCAHFDRADKQPLATTKLVADAECSAPNTAVDRYFAIINGARPQLVKFMRKFPKGGDIHNHLSGTIMPKDYIALGIAEGVCYDTGNYALAAPPCTAVAPPLSQAGTADRQDIVKALSMEKFTYPDIQSGHDHFFSTFGKFRVVSGNNQGAMLAKLLQQADEDSVSYVETMMSFQATTVSDLTEKLQQRYPADGPYYTNSRYYPQMYTYLLGNGLRHTASAAKTDLSGYQAEADAILGCGTDGPNPACGIIHRFLAEVNRNAALPKVFTQTALAFLLTRQAPLVVGVNLVSGEDLPTSMRDFGTQMQMFGFFHEHFKEVNIALHAGEITPCFVGAGNPALKNHIGGSIAAGAKRIGHGISFEFLDADDKNEIVDSMRRNDVLVEILLTSNAQILGVTGNDHPFPQYFRERRLPVAFSTDDEGVSYRNYTIEWLYAALKYNLNYDELVTLARNSLQYNFLPGQPLWRDVAAAKTVDQCAGLQPGSTQLTDRCREFLQGSDKATQQWRYEAVLNQFTLEYGLDLDRYLAGQQRGNELAGVARARVSANP
jgi:adenosine deaminase